MESHNGMRALGKLYGFLPLTIATEDELEVAEDELRIAEDELEVAEDEVKAIADDKLAAGRSAAVSLKELICFFVFCSRDSVNEFIGVNCLSNGSSACAAENVPKNAMINRILRYMDLG